ncbi:MAG: TonB family protein [Verrucomicrobiales bacterium]|jgi:TonB family protein
MPRRLILAVLAAILTHVALWVAFAMVPWNSSAPESPGPQEEPSDEPQFMTVPRQAQLLVTSAESRPSPDPPPPELPPSPPIPEPIIATSTTDHKKEQNQAKEDKEHALRLQAADRALAEARRRDRALINELAQRSVTPALREIPRSQLAPRPVQPATTRPPAPPQIRPRGETRGPVTLRQTKPNYPRALERKGIGGRVSVLLDINGKGRVSSATVQRSSGQPQLDKAAIASAKKWRFKAALKNGAPVASRTAVNIVFQPKQ